MFPPEINRVYRKITKLRNVLNQLVENDGKYEDIYVVSQKLDRLVVLYHKLITED